jgi:hypothetical protein
VDKTFQGYTEAGLLSMLAYTGHTPSSSSSTASAQSLDTILTNAQRPVVVFPECTTSNNVGWKGLKLSADVKDADVLSREVIASPSAVREAAGSVFCF